MRPRHLPLPRADRSRCAPTGDGLPVCHHGTLGFGNPVLMRQPDDRRLGHLARTATGMSAFRAATIDTRSAGATSGAPVLIEIPRPGTRQGPKPVRGSEVDPRRMLCDASSMHMWMGTMVLRSQLQIAWSGNSLAALHDDRGERAGAVAGAHARPVSAEVPRIQPREVPSGSRR